MEQRIKTWYESGMAETYLYVCLVEAIEDNHKEGLVLYDPRADWKLKADVLVLIRGKMVRINAFDGDMLARPQIEAKRDEVERIRKRNTGFITVGGAGDCPTDCNEAQVHVNTAEGMWTDVRNFLRMFKGVHKKNLSGYIAIFESRRNLKRISPDFLSVLVSLRTFDL